MSVAGAQPSVNKTNFNNLSKYQPLCKAIEKDFRDLDSESFAKKVNRDAFLARGFAPYGDMSKNPIMNTLYAHFPQIAQGALSMIPLQGQVDCLGVVIFKSHPHVVLRMLGGRGMQGFVFFRMSTSKANSIEDWFSFSNAEYASVAGARLIMMLFGQPNQVQNFFAVDSHSKAVSDKVILYLRLMKSGDYEQAVDILKQLPKAVQHERFVLLFNVAYLPYASKDRLASFEKLIEKFHSDPDLAYVLMDYYMLQQDCDSIDTLFMSVPAIIRNDVSSIEYRALCAYDAGDYQTSLKLANQAVAQDPTIPSFYIALLDVQLKLKDCAGAKQTLAALNDLLVDKITLPELYNNDSGCY